MSKETDLQERILKFVDRSNELAKKQPKSVKESFNKWIKQGWPDRD